MQYQNASSSISAAQDSLRLLERFGLFFARLLARVVVLEEPVAVLVKNAELILGSLELLATYSQAFLVRFGSTDGISLGRILILEDLGVLDSHGLGVAHKFLVVGLSIGLIGLCNCCLFLEL